VRLLCPPMPIRSRAGTVITVDIDVKANAFAVQHHSPDLHDGKDPNEGEARRTPSEVLHCPLPPSSGLNVLDCRPCLAWWGPSAISEVEASDAFPLWARADEAVSSSK
jgi:hypothetical protein